MKVKRDINRPRQSSTNTIEARGTSITIIIVGTRRNITIDATLGLARIPRELKTHPTLSQTLLRMRIAAQVGLHHEAGEEGDIIIAVVANSAIITRDIITMAIIVAEKSPKKRREVVVIAITVSTIVVGIIITTTATTTGATKKPLTQAKLEVTLIQLITKCSFQNHNNR